jgi:hypothetical protein
LKKIVLLLFILAAPICYAQTFEYKGDSMQVSMLMEDVTYISPSGVRYESYRITWNKSEKIITIWSEGNGEAMNFAIKINGSFNHKGTVIFTGYRIWYYFDGIKKADAKKTLYEILFLNKQ